MCLIVIGVSSGKELILAGNRDEFHARPTAPMGRWDAPEGVVGGRDLKAGGTWLAAHDNGRFATVTNSRDGAPPNPELRSRGLLITDFLTGTDSALDFLQRVDGSRYAGFNLLVHDGSSLGYTSNRDSDGPRLLEPGTYAVSNALLDTPWHKVERIRQGFASLTHRDALTDDAIFELLRDEKRAPASTVEAGALPWETAHRLTAAFIRDENYGTRCSTIVRRTADGLSLCERRFTPEGSVSGESRFQLSPS